MRFSSEVSGQTGLPKIGGIFDGDKSSWKWIPKIVRVITSPTELTVRESESRLINYEFLKFNSSPTDTENRPLDAINTFHVNRGIFIFL